MEPLTKTVYYFRIVLMSTLIVIENVELILYCCFICFTSTATLVCSKTTSNLRYCNPYAEASSAGVYVRKGSKNSKQVTKAKTTTKSTSKSPSAVTKKKLIAKKYAPVLRKTKNV